MHGSVQCNCNADMTCDGALVCMGGKRIPPLNCGNGKLDTGEQCDNGAMNGDTAACKSDCTNQVCGDGKVGPMEACDNGNNTSKHGQGCFQCTKISQAAVASEGTHV